MAVSGLVDGSPGTQVAAGRPAESRSGADLSRSDGRTPVSPSLSDPDEPSSPETLSLAADPPDQLEVSTLTTLETDKVASQTLIEQPILQPTDEASPSTAPSTGPSQTSTAMAADDTSPQTYASTSSSGGDAWVVSFSANEPSSFECSFDGGAFESCASTIEYTGLDPGVHTFSVRAIDTAGNLDESPASLRRQPTGKLSTAK